MSNKRHCTSAHTTEHALDHTAKCFQPPGTPKESLQSMTKLLQAQTEMISAQAHAVAIQSLLALPHFAGQDVDLTTDEDSFDTCRCMAGARGRLAGWIK